MMDNSPLFNHLVLEKILNKLHLSDLKSCRLVCTCWNYNVIPQLIKIGELHLEGRRLEEFLSQTNPHPFTYYNIKISSSLSTCSKIEKMWETIHSSIKFLTLHITTFYAHKALKSLLLYKLPNLINVKLVVMKYWGTSSFPVATENQGDEASKNVIQVHSNPNLKFFQLCYLGFDDGAANDEFRFPIHWKSFFIRFPQIVHLGLVGLSQNDVTNMLIALEESERDADGSFPINLRSLEILDENIFPEAPTDDHLTRLVNLRQPFESLHFEISPVTTSAVLNSVIAHNASSLRSLKLRRYPYPFIMAPITLTNTVLSSVSILEVSNNFIPSLSFLPFLPALRSLHIILRDYRSLPCCEIVQNTNDPRQVSHCGVKYLYIEPPLISNDCIKRLALCFPRLEGLRLRVDDEMLETLCLQCQKSCPSGLSGVWNNLQNLHITSWNGLTDEGMTGISQQTLNLWANYSSFDPEQQRTKPYIGLIQDLRSLTIEMWNDYENHITDWSIYYGVLDLQKLQQVSLIRTGVSSTAFEGIRAEDKHLEY